VAPSEGIGREAGQGIHAEADPEVLPQVFLSPQLAKLLHRLPLAILVPQVLGLLLGETELHHPAALVGGADPQVLPVGHLDHRPRTAHGGVVRLECGSFGHFPKDLEERRLLYGVQHLKDVVTRRELRGVHDALLVLPLLFAHDQLIGGALRQGQLDIVAHSGIALKGLDDLAQDAVVLGRTPAQIGGAQHFEQGHLGGVSMQKPDGCGRGTFCQFREDTPPPVGQPHRHLTYFRIFKLVL